MKPNTKFKSKRTEENDYFQDLICMEGYTKMGI